MIDLINVAMGKNKADIVLKNCNIVNVFSGEIEKGDIAIKGDIICGVKESYSGEIEYDCSGKFAYPGLIDGHMHLESTQLLPLEFAKLVVPKGVTTVICDPHEIANVSGICGIEFIAKNSKDLPIDIKLMLPSCVPATPFENSGAVLGSKDIEENINNDYIYGLGEFMNFVGVINGDKEVIKKLECAIKNNKIIDGHAPNLDGKALNAYVVSGVKTDHECTNVKEMQDKISKGMYILLREGSATRNVEELSKGINATNMRRCLLCTDDRHINDLMDLGHLDNNLRKLVKCGISPIWAITMATLNAKECYNLKGVGQIAPSYKADIVIAEDLIDFKPKYVFKNGKLVAENGKALFTASQTIPSALKNTVHIKNITEEDFDIKINSNKAKVIKLVPQNVVTEKVIRDVKVVNGVLDIEGTDLLKLVVIERHKMTGNIGKGLIEGYGLKNGAIATTVSHDSHNIIALGDNNRDMLIATNALKEMGGGMVAVSMGKVLGAVVLDISGLISSMPAEKLYEKHKEITNIAFKLGVSKEVEPFMSLSFLALVVIPSLKISDSGLFDVDKFEFTSLEA